VPIIIDKLFSYTPLCLHSLRSAYTAFRYQLKRIRSSYTSAVQGIVNQVEKSNQFLKSVQ